MVEAVTLYRAEDGQEFASLQAAEERDAEIAANRLPLSQLVEDMVKPEYRGPLHTFEEMLSVHGWAEGEEASCCEQKISVTNLLGVTTQAECKVCGRWALNVSAGQFTGNCVSFPDHIKYDLSDPRHWLVGKQD